MKERMKKMIREGKKMKMSAWKWLLLSISLHHSCYEPRHVPLHGIKWIVLTRTSFPTEPTNEQFPVKECRKENMTWLRNLMTAMIQRMKMAIKNEWMRERGKNMTTSDGREKFGASGHKLTLFPPSMECPCQRAVSLLIMHEWCDRWCCAWYPVQQASWIKEGNKREIEMHGIGEWIR